MILQSLYNLYDRLASDPDYKIAKPGYSPQKISFRIVIKPDGTLFAIEDARIKDDKGKFHAEAQLVLGEAKPSGSGLNPGLLWDNTSYLLGYKKPDKKPAKAAKDAVRALEAFKKLREKHVAQEQSINHPDFSSICRFLEKWDLTKVERVTEIQRSTNELLDLENNLTNDENGENISKINQLKASKEKLEAEAGDDLKLFSALDEFSTGFGIFQIQGQIQPVNELPHILQWWDEQAEVATTDLGQCLITGEQKPIARLHPKIKSVTGAQSAGASLVSFNDNAYESYMNYAPHGSKGPQGKVSPVSETAAFRYGTALNSLLNGPKSRKHRIRIGDTTCVFWTDKPSIVEDAFSFFASDGSNAQDQSGLSKIGTFLKALRQGKDTLEELGEDPDNTRFYILGLAPNAARLSVRFFHQSSVAEFIENLRAHHQDISIIREWETAKGKRQADPEFPPNWQLLRETARVTDEIPPLLGGSLMRAILENTPYPEGIYSAVIRRIRADRTINYIRAAIIKGTLSRNHNQTISTMLDTENTDPAYLLGRLFAALEKTQGDALGDLNAGLRDKYYSSASATPASVFPRILRTYQHHLAKLEGGHKVNRERLIQDVLDPLNDFPSQLNLKAQGHFALGYYHQRKSFFTKKETK